eukprot:366088-Chlamydomonas_euryale.AAC.8
MLHKDGVGARRLGLDRLLQAPHADHADRAKRQNTTPALARPSTSRRLTTSTGASSPNAAEKLDRTAVPRPLTCRAIRRPGRGWGLKWIEGVLIVITTRTRLSSEGWRAYSKCLCVSGASTPCPFSPATKFSAGRHCGYAFVGTVTWDWCRRALHRAATLTHSHLSNHAKAARRARFFDLHNLRDMQPKAPNSSSAARTTAQHAGGAAPPT